MINQNIDKSLLLDNKIEDGFYLLKFHNEQAHAVHILKRCGQILFTIAF